MALWGGRFTQAADQRFKQFNDSLRFDYRLAEQDIVGSVAWSKALVTVGVLTADEQQQLEEALNNLLEEVRLDPEQILQSDAEDIHSWVEGKLIDKVGQLGKKLHTGRSRNDQVATDLKLWCKETVGELLAANRQLQSALVDTAQSNQDAVMPGYTHLQRAQPVTFAHWCLAYVEAHYPHRGWCARPGRPHHDHPDFPGNLPIGRQSGTHQRSFRCQYRVRKLRPPCLADRAGGFEGCRHHSNGPHRRRRASL